MVTAEMRNYITLWYRDWLFLSRHCHTLEMWHPTQPWVAHGAGLWDPYQPKYEDFLKVKKDGKKCLPTAVINLQSTRDLRPTTLIFSLCLCLCVCLSVSLSIFCSDKIIQKNIKLWRFTHSMLQNASMALCHALAGHFCPFFFYHFWSFLSLSAKESLLFHFFW